ncbi:MAG: glycosyltransferase [Alphaproteobacteria bacterium]|nr:glycosyltransferase [Alphaproteobacteria bacterium]
MDAAAAFSPDVIVVHAITHFLGPQDVLALQQATGAPVIWHLMDMAVFTGGCHYAWDCRKYETACRECPALRLPGKTDLAARAWEAKKQAMAAIKGHVVAGASRLAMQARASAVLGHLPIDKIMLGLVPSEFGPKDIREERRHLDIPEDGRVVFFGVQNFDERRKGARHLLDALRQLPAKMPAGSELPFLLIAGKPAGMPNFDSLGYRHRYLGFLNAPALAKVYAAADVFICPSIEDSGPMMVNEALMSGTPVVAFRMGVVPDLVEPGITGEIAELGDASSLAEGLSRVLLWDDAARAQSRRRCREVAIAKSGASLQVARFVALAKSLNSGGGNCGMTASRTRSGDKG